jgi:hypothetical protein
MTTKNSILEKAKSFPKKKECFSGRVCTLLLEGEFNDILSSQDFVHCLNEGPGKKIKIANLASLMEPLLKAGIVKIKIEGKGRNKRKYWFPGWIEKEQVKSKLSTKTTINEDILPQRLVTALGSDFEVEISDLYLNYGKSGTCTAFLLRKILEKMIYLAFAKNGMSNKLEDTSGGCIGLKTMINLAKENKVHGKPFLMPKTAKEVEGIKFLGDTSAHNPLTNVKLETIIPQLPYIITAYEELSRKL